ncbi:MAG TPA: hypothetical protein VI362_03300 [Ignavibacteriaceae bacterium]|nr:hypothetical protein [Ignavibacteriaceae bacterium]
MSSTKGNGINTFRYNTSFYYQSTIIYLIVFVLYLVIRGEFVEQSYTLVIQDPVLYFLAIIVFVSVVALVYNLFINKHIEFSENKISFIDRFKTRSFNIDKINQIRFSRQRRAINSRAFRTIRIKINSRIRPIVIRISDYENQDELLARFEELKSKIENK